MLVLPFTFPREGSETFPMPRETLPPVDRYRHIPMHPYQQPRVEVSTRGRVRVDGKIKELKQRGKKMRLMVDGEHYDAAELLRRTCGVPECPSGIWPDTKETRKWELWLPVCRSAYN